MKELLLNYDANVLKEIARAHSVDIRTLAKPQVVERLAARLAERAEIERSLAAARALERDILARIHGAGGTVWSDALKRILLNERRLKPTPKNKEYYWQEYEGDPDYAGTPALEDVVARLTRLGLLFSRGTSAPTRVILNREMGRELVIPEPVRAVLPPATPAGGTTAPEPSRVVAGSARIFQRDLSRYWSFVRRTTPLELTSQGWLYKKTQTELLKTLGWTVDKKTDEQHTPRLFFIRQLLRALNLLAAPPTRGQYPPEQNSFTAADAANFWSRTPHERMKLTFEAWRDGVSWNELRVPPASYNFDHRRAAPAELKAARQVILDHMRRHGADGWVALPALLDDVRLAHYEFLFPHRPSPYSYRDYSGYYQSRNPYGISYKDVQNSDEGWEKVEAVIISHVVTGVLHWMGLTDVGFEGDGPAGTRPQVASAAAAPSRPDGMQEAGALLPVAYRLTPVGAWLLGIGEQVALANEGGRVIVQPNFQIVALEPIVDDLLLTLDEFAQFEGGDQALTYRLTRESVYRGQRAHWDAARIVTYLEEAVAAPLPQNVKRTLEDWDALSRRITFHRDVALLQADEPATLDGLLADPGLARVLGRRAAPVVALPAGTAQATLEALHNAGWLPHVTTAVATDASASLIADGDGLIEVAARAPNIYAYGAVAAFVEWEDARHARITPGSVRAAVEAGVPVPAILARLKSVQRGELPPGLAQRIKAWGKFYGDARGGAFTLIEFRDEAARSELLADPELRPYLTRFEAGPRPLAAVPAADYERVRALLAERGIEVLTFG